MIADGISIEIYCTIVFKVQIVFPHSSNTVNAGPPQLRKHRHLWGFTSTLIYQHISFSHTRSGFSLFLPM